ncbi:AGAP009406-PA, partial [Anopheles gambiae str. PEST]
HDTLPRWICKPCLEKVDDFAAFRERCKQNERKLLLGEEDILHTKDGPAVGQTGEQTEEEEEEDDDDEEMEMIVIDPSRDYESSNDSLLHRSDADEGDEEEEEEEEDELKCDTAPGGTAPNGLPDTSFHTAASNTAPQKTVVFTCKYCDVAFAAASACQLHEMQDHDLLAPYACIFCQYKTSIRMFLITHIRDSHAVTRPYICIQCNKGFLRRSDLKKHTFVHTGVRPYACDQCGKSFSRNTNLKKHMRTHLGVKPHGCDLCPRSFANKADLIRHRSFHHAQETQHACIRCGAVYTQKDKLYDHERYCMGKPLAFGMGEMVKQEPAPFGLSVTAPIPPPPQPAQLLQASEPIVSEQPPNARPYECPVCRKQIVGKREYDRHQQTHSELKPFGCGTCGKRFSRRDKLHRHERIHQQAERTFTCPHCTARFVRKDAYESHLKVH